ncbi:MAG TPA: hypothetical protein VN457_02935 [Chlamydiales bacterium]|nr:hypothetical protein [Chlamydiales bacterium]
MSLEDLDALYEVNRGAHGEYCKLDLERGTLIYEIDQLRQKVSATATADAKPTSAASSSSS